MNTEHHRYDYRWRERFPGAFAVLLLEGGAVFAAHDEIAYWLITDEGTLADFALPEDEDMLDAMVKIERFEDEASWRAAIDALKAKLPAAARYAERWNSELT
jgi:hypothetical protein